jgi:hypothetical protein
MDNFDLKKYLVENKVTTQSKQLNERLDEGNTNSFPTFKGSTMKEFVIWAVPIFKKYNVPKEDYVYWFDQFDGGELSEYNGMTEMELMNVHFGAWFPEYATEMPTNEPYADQIKKYR